ncbi:Atypical/ABC1/ABC1-A protein Kinase [Phytophthora cinnamomi]|uniref:Atypical/ABC1/ABC1-A protein Kinase n=1 Tax=Phytophthora cinnamomi TaxID=4785 RepID=UPI003559F377|nr:Atypical/ABC1/ABC1-A protein Kinase [Phytophthora cinnamomi]
MSKHASELARLVPYFLNGDGAAPSQPEQKTQEAAPVLKQQVQTPAPQEPMIKAQAEKIRAPEPLLKTPEPVLKTPEPVQKTVTPPALDEEPPRRVWEEKHVPSSPLSRILASEASRPGCAHVMPKDQLHHQLETELGEDWRSKFQEFDDVPIAAASIGQVHRATLLNGERVAIKIQYPGVAESIGSDLSNLKRLVTYTNILPRGLYIDEIIRVGKEELTAECDYLTEAENQERFRS